MKTCPIQNLCLIASLLTVYGLVSASAEDQSPTPSISPSATASATPSPSASMSPPGGGDACNYYKWNPEAYCFYGEKAKIVDKLSNLSTVELSERRVYLQITQGESSGDVRLYERQKNGTFTVTEWTTPQTSHLLTELDKVIIGNKGVNCVGEQIKSLLGKELKHGKVSEGVAAPESFKAAFAHSVNAAKGAFIRSIVFLAC